MASDVLDLADEWGPEKIVCVSDTRTGMRGALVVDNTSRGMGKGGTRMSPTLTAAEVARLARVMTWKWAAADLFFGGAKAGIRFDPASPRKEEALRAFVRRLRNEVPSEYVFGLDMGLTEADAAIVQDEVGDKGAAVGTPYALGGVPYDELGVTGYGVAECADAAAQQIGLQLVGARIAIQGFGAVGTAAARRFAELGAIVVSISTARGALHQPDGFDVEKLLQLHAECGDEVVLQAPGAPIPLGQELLVPAEVAVPAALQDTVNVDVARQMSAKLVIEGANLPTDLTAQEYFHDNGVALVPDFIANAGGIIAAATAMDARHSPLRPEPEGIRATISARIRGNTTTVLAAARTSRVTPHEAARSLAQDRVRDAMLLKRRWPAKDVLSDS